MKRNRSQIICVLLSLVLVLSLSLPYAAATVNEQISFNKVNVVRFRTTEIEAGKMITAQNGQQIPGAITYTDATGTATNYLPVRKITELTDTRSFGTLRVITLC